MRLIDFYALRPDGRRGVFVPETKDDSKSPKDLNDNGQAETGPDQSAKKRLAS